MNFEISGHLNSIFDEFLNIVQQEFCPKNRRDYEIDSIYEKIFLFKKHLGKGDVTFIDEVRWTSEGSERVRSFTFIGKQNNKVDILIEFVTFNGVPDKSRYRTRAVFEGSRHEDISVSV